MFIEKFVVLFVAFVLIYLLSRKFVLRYAPENILILAMLSFSFGVYLGLVINSLYIPVIIQVPMLIFILLLPILFAYLQYNNIILSRKILYYKMKWQLFVKNYNKAIGYINRLINIDGRKAEYFHILGQCYKNQKDFINSRDAFAMAVELDRRDYKSYYELGLVLDETNKKETAIVMFNNALRLKPSYYEAAEALGICLTSQAKYKDAVKVYENAIEHHPTACELYYNIAMIQLELGDYDKAEEAFSKAAEIKPKLYSAYYNIGRINYLKGDYDKAIEFYKLSCASTVYGCKSYFKLAIVYAAKKDYEKSMSALEYAVEIEPEYLKETKNELVFANMKERIEKYESDRNKLTENKKKKKNYMEEKKQEEIVEEGSVETPQEN